jgi:hypothetical protein
MAETGAMRGCTCKKPVEPVALREEEVGNAAMSLPKSCYMLSPDEGMYVYTAIVGLNLLVLFHRQNRPITLPSSR